MEAEEKFQPEEATEAGEPEQAAGESLDLPEHDQPEEAEIAADHEPPAGEPLSTHEPVHASAPEPVHAPEPEPAAEHVEPPAEEPAAAAAGGYNEASPKKWFIIHTYSGFENKVAESLKTRADAFGFADKIGQILIPTEEVVELRNGKKVTSKRLVYPGYVLVEMEMNDQLWHEVKNTPRVTGFVGGGNAPVPLSADEVNQILYRQQSSAERPRPKMTFEKNDSVRIVDGPFANFSGKVDEVNPERGTLRVMVTIFGRATPVELEFLQVEKA
jgi:transcriptional antiterminator NusG